MKAKIFVGPPGSGKTRVAKMIAEHVGKEKVFFMSASMRKTPFMFNGIHHNTELLIIDDCQFDFDYSLFSDVQDKRPYGGELKFKIWVEEPTKKPVELLIPQIIFITEKLNPKWLNFGASFDARFEIIEFPLNQ